MQALPEVCSRVCGWSSGQQRGEDEHPPGTELCCAVDGFKGQGEAGVKAGALALQKALLVCTSGS